MGFWRRPTIATAAAALLLACAPAVADAAPAQPAAVDVVVGVPLSDSRSAAEILRNASSGVPPSRSSDADGVHTLSANPGRLSATQRQQLTAPGPYTYSVDSSAYDPELVRPFSAIDTVGSDECRDYLTNHAGGFWYKNHFAACTAQKLVYSYYPKATGPPSGVAIASWVTTANMEPDSQRVTVTQRLWDWEIDGTVPLDRQIGLATGCLATNAAAGSLAHCDRYDFSVSRTIPGWQANDSASQTFTMTGEDPPSSIPNDPTVPEKRTYFYLDGYAYLYGGPGKYDRYSQVDSPELPYRCDIARSINTSYARTTDCIYTRVSAVFRIDLQEKLPDGTDAVRESAQLIYDAQHDITLTYPGAIGTYVPGELSGEHGPLTRLYQSYNQKLYDANRAKSVSACTANWGKYTERDGVPGVNDCDEYPFASTLEGSATLTEGSARTFAVRPVLRGQNRRVGSRLGNFYADDHILHDDPFYVEVVNP